MMQLIDDLVNDVDVETALEQVLESYRTVSRRRQRGRVVAAAVVAVLCIASLAWWRSVGHEQSLDVRSDGQASDGRTANAVTVQAGDGLVLTLSVDDDHVSVGDAVEVELTLSNQGTATFSGPWNVPSECGGAISFAVRMIDPAGGSTSIPNLSSGDNTWFASRAGLEAAVRDQVADGGSSEPNPGDGPPDPMAPHIGDVAVPAVLGGTPQLTWACDAGPSTQQLAPGQSITRGATWQVWIGPGDIGQRGSFRIDGHADAFGCSGCVGEVVPSTQPGCETCALFGIGDVSVPIWVDPASRVAPPTAEQLVAAVGRSDVQQMLDNFGPRMNGSTELGFGGWLLQIGDRWLQRIQGERGAVDIWFDRNGSVIAVQVKTGADAVAVPADASSSASSPAIGSMRLTPLPSELPDMPPTDELERRAATVPADRRQLWGTNDDGTITGWSNPDDQPANAFPIFGFDDKLIGIYVSGLGIIDRSRYDAPDFDPEAAARDKWGDEEYFRRLHGRQVVQQRADELQDDPGPP